MFGLNGAQLGDTDLEIAEDFQQKRFKFHIGPVDLVDEQNNRFV